MCLSWHFPTVVRSTTTSPLFTKHPPDLLEISTTFCCRFILILREPLKSWRSFPKVGSATLVKGKVDRGAKKKGSIEGVEENRVSPSGTDSDKSDGVWMNKLALLLSLTMSFIW